ncbi:MAG: hypothetical protein R3F11_32780 [Verrucomicrobiales bacterium]
MKTGPARPPRSPMRRWMQSAAAFGAAVDDPGQEATLWGDGADPDLDGRTNLEEYAEGTDPLAADAPPPAGLRLEGTGAARTLVYEMPLAAPPADVVWTAEFSAALGGWQPAAVEAGSTGVRAVAPAGSAAGFVRFGVARRAP